MAWRALSLLLIVALPGAAVAAPDFRNPVRNWIFSQLAQGAAVDLQAFCGRGPADPRRAACRTIPAGFVVALASDPVLTAVLPREGVRISHAIIAGDVDLTDAPIPHRLEITDSLFTGRVDLGGAHVATSVALTRSRVAGLLHAAEADIAGDLTLDSLRADDGVDLTDARIGGELGLVAAAIEPNLGLFQPAQGLRLSNLSVGHDAHLSGVMLAGPLDATGARIGGSLFLDHTTDHALTLVDMRTDGDLSLDDAQVSGMLNLDSARVAGTLHMEDVTLAKAAVARLQNLHVGDYWLLRGNFPADVEAQSLHVGGMADIEAGTRFGGTVVLTAADIGSDLTVGCATTGATCDKDAVVFSGRLLARSLRVAGTASLRGATFRDEAMLGQMQVGADLDLREASFARPLRLHAAHVVQDLLLQEAHPALIDLSEAVVGGVLELGTDAATQTCWPVADTGHARLILADAQLGVLERPAYGWPAKSFLFGLTYGRFGSADGFPPEDGAAADGCAAPVHSWIGWLRRDVSASTQPYMQLASVLAAEGKRDDADDALFAGRDLERSAACGEGLGFSCVSLTLLRWLGGYGIGRYTWNAGGWVLALALAGALVALTVRQDGPRRWVRHFLWCCGAAIEKLLPYVHIDRSFTAFFDEGRNFRVWHKVAFAVLALAGSVLGLFLAAAASGLTQHG